MREPKNSDVTMDSASEEGPASIRAQFESVWQQALQGQPPPSIDSYVNAASDSDRVSLRQELQKLDTEYRQRLAQAAGPAAASGISDTTIAIAAADGQQSARPASADLGATIGLSPDEGEDLMQGPGAANGGRAGGKEKPHPGLDATMNLEAHPDQDATLDPAPDLGETVDPATKSPLGRKTQRPSGKVTFSQTSPPGEEAPASRKMVAGYEVLGELGRGGMGVVYKARQIGLNRVVALKMVLAGAHAGSDQLARFYIEAEAVAGVQHPNIVQIYDVGEHDGLPYFSLEFVDGGSLSDKIAGKPQLPKEAARLLAGIAKGMACAHKLGIIHRDLKPANVLVTREGGIPKITDFGLAKRLESDSGQTRSGSLLGTPSYMAPEQAAGRTKEVSSLSDQYSLGAILYEMLTGRPPLVGTSILQTLALVQFQEPLPPSRLQPGIPRDLETICLKCLQKEPAKRYASTQALVDDLAHFLAEEPIQARPVSRLERAWRWCKRNPRTALLTSMVLALVVMAGTALSALAVNRSREQAAARARIAREEKAIDEARKLADERLKQARDAVAAGDHPRALILLSSSDPLLDSAEPLADVRDQLTALRSQVRVYADFKKLLDDTRFAGLYGSGRQKVEGRELSGRLLALVDQIEQKTGLAPHGLPPLNDQQSQLFKEDAFDAFLLAAIIERELTKTDPAPVRAEAARRAIHWLDRADQIVPGIRLRYAYRADCWEELGNQEAARADVERALAIKPQSPLNHYWHGFAERFRAAKARSLDDRNGAEKNLRRALAEYTAVLQQRPDHVWAYFDWALCHAQLEDPDAAHVGFTACIHIRPDFSWAFNNRATLHLRQKEYALAIQDYSAALARNPRYVQAYEGRSRSYLELGDKERALADLDRVVAVDPDNLAAYTTRLALHQELKQPDKAIEDYTELIRLGADKVSFLVKRAELYRSLQRIDEAIRDYDQALALLLAFYAARVVTNPAIPNTGGLVLLPVVPLTQGGGLLGERTVQLLSTRAGLHRDRGNFLQARDDFSVILTFRTRAVAICDQRARLNWFKLKDFEAALADYQHLARLLPADPTPLRASAELLLGRRRYDEALQKIQKALNLKPKDVLATWVQAQILLWQGKLPQALAAINTVAVKLAPDRPETLNIRGDIYRAMGRLEDAAADYRRLIELRPRAPDTYVSLAGVCEKLGQPEAVRDCFEKLLAADPQSAGPYLKRAEFRRARKEYDAALADCDRAAQLDSQSALPGLIRASIVAAQGDHRRAVAEAERLLKQAPPGNGRVLYAAACVWSLATQAATDQRDQVLADLYAERAKILLTEALDRGFHDLIYPEHNRMADDPALAPIRRRPGVLDLLSHRPLGKDEG